MTMFCIGIKTSERWIKLKLDFEIGQNFYDRLKVNDLTYFLKKSKILEKIITTKLNLQGNHNNLLLKVQQGDGAS